MTKISRRTLFTRLLSALAAVPLVGKLAERRNLSFRRMVTTVDEHARIIITGIDFENKTVYLSTDSEGQRYHQVEEPFDNPAITDDHKREFQQLGLASPWIEVPRGTF